MQHTIYYNFSDVRPQMCFSLATQVVSTLFYISVGLRHHGVYGVFLLPPSLRMGIISYSSL